MKLAFASDYDNTLFFPTGLKEEDIQAIRAFQKKGYLFGVCTGRSLSGVEIPNQGRIQFDFYVLSTGSYIADKNRKVIYSNPIPLPIAKAIQEEYSPTHLMAFNTGADFYSLYQDYQEMFRIDSLEELPAPVHGISFLTDSIKEAEAICKKINSTYEVSAFHNKRFVDISGKGSSKGKAISFLREYYQLDRIDGMGDSFNDLTLLEAVDTSYTFPDSPEILKSKVKKICASVSEALKNY